MGVGVALVGAPLVWPVLPGPRHDARPRAGLVAPAFAQTRQIPLNQKRVRIEQLVRKIGEATERTILVPDDVRGTISIVAQRPVTPGEAWRILDASLSILGFSLLPSTAGNWRIAKVADAVGEAPFQEGSAGGRDAFVTTLIPLRHARNDAVMSVLQPLSGSRVTLVPYDETNSLIASGSERAIARLTDLANALDQVEEQTLRLRVLRHRGVADVEPLVQGYLESAGEALSGVQVWSDVRTNGLIVRGTLPAVERVAAFLDRLDQPARGQGTLRILRILHRDPEEIAERVRALADPGTAATSPAGEAAGPLDAADYTIAVDAPTRSLIVRADPETQEAIREVVELLDARPERIAVDITVSELRTPSGYGFLFGFQLPFALGNDTDDLVGFVRSEPGVGNVQAEPTLVGQIQRDTGVAFTTVQNGIPISVPILQSAAISTLDFEARNEVLIQPSLVVIAGEEHEIFVGDNVPIPVTDSGIDGGQTIGGVNVRNLSRTTRFERRDIGTTLRLEARTGRDGKIQLDLEVELSSISLARAALAGDPREVGPSFTEKELVVRARLDDGETAVLAVDQRRRESSLRAGVPFLRDLPFFGFLFRASGRSMEDVRLMIAARARRVSTPAELVADTIRRRLAFERASARTSGLPGVEGPPYGVRVTTRRRADDADAIAESLALRGHRTRVHRWTFGDDVYHDVYVTHLGSMVDAAALAHVLGDEGWQADLVVLPVRS